MIKEIFIKEVRSHFGSKTMVSAYAIILTLFITNSLIFIKDFKDCTIKHQKMLDNNSELIKKNSLNLWQLTFTSQKLAYPPSVLGFMSEAREKSLPNGIQLDFFSTSNPQYFKDEDIFFSEAEALDWNNILILFISFISIFFSYNAFSGEKVEGTLKLMMSNSVPRSKIMIGKYLGLCFITFLPLLTGVMISVIIFLISPLIQLTLNHFINIIIYLIAASLLISINILIGMLISALTSKPIVSLSFVILIWLFFAIVIPGIGWVITKKTIPIKSVGSVYDKLTIEITALGGSFWNDQWKTPTSEVLAEKNHFDKMNKVINSAWTDYRNSLFNQANSGIALSKISPFQVFRFLGDKISDNGFFRYCNFYNQLKDYQHIYKNFIISKDKTDMGSYHLIWSMQYETMKFMSNKPISYDEVPKFEYKAPSVIQTFNAVKLEFIILAIWNVVLLLATGYSLIKYDVR